MQKICIFVNYAKLLYVITATKVRNKAVIIRFSADLTELS